MSSDRMYRAQVWAVYKLLQKLYCKSVVQLKLF